MNRIAALILLFAAAAALESSAAVTISGNVRYEDMVYSRPPANIPESRTYTAARKAMVQGLDSGGTLRASGATDENGVFTLSWSGGDAMSVVVETRSLDGAVRVGSGFSGGSVTGVYQWSVCSLSGNSVKDLNIAASSSSAAMNIFNQISLGRDWFSSMGHNFSKTLSIVWPGSSTQFDPESFYLELQEPTTDPDGFDDDIILHEFGHMALEQFGVDNSLGGAHSITSKVDLRMSWSEGAAHYISSAIRNDPVHVDSKGYTGTGGVTVADAFSIASPSTLAKGSENEWAVASVLWQASQAAGHSAVISAVRAFDRSEPASFDRFHELWLAQQPAAGLSAAYSDRGMSYQNDSLAQYTASNPTAVDAFPFVRTGLTFFPSGNKDYLAFTAQAGENFDIDTGECTNGALTTIQVFQGGIGAVVASNSQRFGLASDANSYVFLKVTQPGQYLVEISRFTSSTQNYGLGSGDGYTQTAGRYGMYSMSISKTSSAEADSKRSAITGYTPAPAPPPAAAQGGGGSSGGCLLGGIW